MLFAALYAVNKPHNHRMIQHRPLRTPRYIWQLPAWPQLSYDAAALAEPLAQVHRAQGLLMGRMAELGLAQRAQATLQVLTQEVIKTSEIEGELLNVDTVRSSIARRLGVDIGALAPSDRHVDGVVDVVLDATGHYDQPLSAERLFGWHAALFPTGYSGRMRIRVAAWRDDASGPMEVVSGAIGREKVHFQAPPADTLARARQFAGFSLHPGSPWTAVETVADQVAVTTPKGRFVFDFLILGTGFVTDLSLRPELAALKDDVALWADRYTPPADQRFDDLGRHPYLGPSGEFLPKHAGQTPWVSSVFCYTFAGLPSLGFAGAFISGLKYSLPKLVDGVTRQLYADDADHFFSTLAAYDVKEF